MRMAWLAMGKKAMKRVESGEGPCGRIHWTVRHTTCETFRGILRRHFYSLLSRQEKGPA
jgi:hypothetical protein